jgi:cytoskeleton protein RodZ
MLEAQRLARGLTIADVAQRLKYGVRQIEALERDDYVALPGTTFVRGMIRGYAKLLELDSAPILSELDRRHIPAQVSVDLRSTSIPFPVGGRRSTHVYGVVSVMAVVAALLVGYEWQFGGFSWLWQFVSEEVLTAKQAEPENRKEPTTQATSLQPVAEPVVDSTAAPVPLTPSVTDSNATVISGKPPGGGQQVAPMPSPVSVGVPAAIPGAVVASPAVRQSVPGSVAQPSSAAIEPRTAGGRARMLALQFERDSWVEIKQSNGRILMSQLNRGGTEQMVEGVPPFEIIIGNAPNVRLIYNNAPVDLRPHLKVDVARLTLE